MKKIEELLRTAEIFAKESEESYKLCFSEYSKGISPEISTIYLLNQAIYHQNRAIIELLKDKKIK